MNTSNGSRHPISGRQARASLGATQTAVNAQAKAVVDVHDRLSTVETLLANFVKRGFFGRLRLLVVGR